MCSSRSNKAAADRAALIEINDRRGGEPVSENRMKAIEIERRFLVRDPQAALSHPACVRLGRFEQGYLGWVGGLRMRARFVTQSSGKRTATLTLKGRRCGICREEFEHPVAPDWVARLLGALPASRIIRKHRYSICLEDGLVWSIDCFEPPNAGLVIAEVELARPDQNIVRPPWIGEEITFDPRYGNSSLAASPMPD
jgi:CYTH domain-containing protein